MYMQNVLQAHLRFQVPGFPPRGKVAKGRAPKIPWIRLLSLRDPPPPGFTLRIKPQISPPFSHESDALGVSWFAAHDLRRGGKRGRGGRQGREK